MSMKTQLISNTWGVEGSQQVVWRGRGGARSLTHLCVTLKVSECALECEVGGWAKAKGLAVLSGAGTAPGQAARCSKVCPWLLEGLPVPLFREEGTGRVRICA